MLMFRRFGALLMVTAFASSGVAGAQTPPVGAGGSDQTAPPPSTAASGQRAGGPAQAAVVNPVAALNQVQNMLDGAVLVRAQDALQLSDAQWLAFFPKMRELQQLRIQHQRNRVQLINGLNQATKPGSVTDEATLTSRVKALDDLEAQMGTDERTALAAVDAVLTAFQRARFRVFEENNEREKLRLLAKVMAAPGRGPAPEAAPVPFAKPSRRR
jgi:hypothetical protein